MPDYTNSIIYKIVCKDLNITDCYVGSTTNFNSRKSCHKAKHNNPNLKGHNFKVYKFIREHGGWDNWDMIMVEKYPCNDKLELLKKEREILETLKATLNKQIPTRTEKERKEYDKVYIKQYRLDNKEKCKEYIKQYRQDNKEYISKLGKKYREKNKEKFQEYMKEYRLNKKESINEKIGCRICKCMLRKSDFKRHTKSKKHIDNINAADQKC